MQAETLHTMQLPGVFLDSVTQAGQFCQQHALHLYSSRSAVLRSRVVLHSSRGSSQLGMRQQALECTKRRTVTNLGHAHLSCSSSLLEVSVGLTAEP